MLPQLKRYADHPLVVAKTLQGAVRPLTRIAKGLIRMSPANGTCLDIYWSPPLGIGPVADSTQDMAWTGEIAGVVIVVTRNRVLEPAISSGETHGLGWNRGNVAGFR